MLACECSFLFLLLTAKDVSIPRIVSCGEERRETGVFTGYRKMWGYEKGRTRLLTKTNYQNLTKGLKKIQVLQYFTGENGKKKSN